MFNQSTVNRTGHRRRGFTLVELLVVVAIIALLIRILLPSLSKARQEARAVKCGSLHKEFGNANQMYANEFDERFIPINTSNRAGYDYYRWFSLPWVQKTLSVTVSDPQRQPEPLRCPTPDFPNPQGSTTDWLGLTHGTNLTHVDNYLDSGEMGGNYAQQGAGNSNFLDWTYGFQIFRQGVLFPAMKAQISDANYFQVWQPGANFRTHWDVFGETTQRDGGKRFTVSYRHGETANILHFDGHVERYSKQEAWPDDQEARNRLWQSYRDETSR